MSANDDFIEFAGRAADAVRPIVMQHFRTAVTIEAKADASPVTIADREAERCIRDMIKAEFPDHGIIGEEFGAQNADAEYVWVLDPIDGTAGYVTGKPLFGTLIALSQNKKPIVGIIDAPALGERWVGATGRATTLNSNEATTRDCAKLSDAWLYATDSAMFKGGDADAFARLSTQTRRTVYGADCYAYGLLASGHVDLVCEASMGVYDFMALAPVVIGAGGTFSDWQGGDVDLNTDGRVLAAGSAAMHKSAKDILNT